jgi:alanine racemase
MSRAAEARINLDALVSNLFQVKRNAPDSRVVAVIKANGYGHGMVRVARALQQAEAFAVASIDEALELRGAGINHPLLLLEGFFNHDELVLIRQNQLSVVVHQDDQLQALENLGKQTNDQQQNVPQSPIPVWLKIDTGMHRLGFRPEQAAGVYARLKQCSHVAPTITLMTHLANADDRQDETTAHQVELFYQAESTIKCTNELAHSIANSAGILAWPQTHFNDHPSWVRPGIMLYGVSPLIDTTAADHDLQPVMTLCSRLIAIKHCQAGDAVGYGGSWRCPEDMTIGVVAIGYGDGYPRAAALGTPVLINGRRVFLVGRVSMDMITVDLRQCPGASIGDDVVLWGEGLPVEEIARHAGTIAYDLLCGVTTRVRRLATGSLSEDSEHDYQSKTG